MNNLPKTHLHPIKNASALDSRLRLLLQNPKKILKKHIQPNMTVLDLGCGTGYFTTEIAKLLDQNGKVIAIDVQEGMLDILKQKIRNTELKQQIEIRKNQENTLDLMEKVDFIFAFYSFHEMKFIDNIIGELNEITKPKTKIFISEQKLHVSKFKFNSIIQKLKNEGFKICERPKVFFSRTIVMEKIN